MLASEGRKHEHVREKGGIPARGRGKGKRQQQKSPTPKIKINFCTPDKSCKGEIRRSDTPTELPSPVPGMYHFLGRYPTWNFINDNIPK